MKSNTEPTDVPLNVRIPRSLNDGLQSLKNEYGLNISAYIRRLIQQDLELRKKVEMQVKAVGNKKPVVGVDAARA